VEDTDDSKEWIRAVHQGELRPDRESAFVNLAHGQDYQKIAAAAAWSWSPERASVGDSFVHFPNTYQVELIRKKNKYGAITLRLLDDGKELVSWEGHFRSVFSLNGDVLVYADFLPTRTGCSVVAYDLKTQKQLWKANLKGLGDIAHFRYSNSVNLEILKNDAIRVFGNESAGQYLEIVDLKTGKTVGHRIYQQ
jgi:hypothetical protein